MALARSVRSVKVLAMITIASGNEQERLALNEGPPSRRDRQARCDAGNLEIIDHKIDVYRGRSPPGTPTSCGRRSGCLALASR
jgi:hypothetical protein